MRENLPLIYPVDMNNMLVVCECPTLAICLNGGNRSRRARRGLFWRSLGDDFIPTTTPPELG